MKIVRIFTDIKIDDCYIWSVIYDNEYTDEFNRLFDLWTNVEYLRAFFTEHIKDLQADFWNNLSIRSAVLKTIREAEDFEDMITDIEHGLPWKGISSIKQIFRPLDNREYLDKTYQKQKARPQNNLPFLRLYGIRLADDSIIVTGGAIKLTEKMDGRKHLMAELRKIERVKSYLNENEIIYLEDLITI